MLTTLGAWTVDHSAGTFSIPAAAYVPFEPRTAEHLALRTEIRRRLKELRAAPGEILWASFSGLLPSGTDIENVLLYNLNGGGAFTGSLDNGVTFELDPDPAPRGVRYTYGVVPTPTAFRFWQSERELASIVAELDATPTLASIWWELRSGSGSIRPAGSARRAGEPFALMLEVEGPVRRLTPALVKRILDGAICGLQSQTDTGSAAQLAFPIARALNVPVRAVEEALTCAGHSALGVRTRLVHARGRSVQWAPDDDHCVAARLLFKRADRWRIAGTVGVVATRTVN